MRGRAFGTVVAAMLAAFAFAAPAVAQSEPRLALLIGNQDYPAEPGRLRRPHRDVATLETALEAAGFLVEVERDADAERIRRAVAAFAGRLDAAGDGAVGFFYYAGHGAVALSEGRRRNFMLPAGAAVSSAADVALSGVRLDAAIDALENADAATLFVVYDACRNSFLRTGGDRGIAVERTRGGLLLAMSTMADATTPDDGAYAIALAEEIGRSGQTAEIAFLNASRAVGSGRPRDQLPTVSPSLMDEFCFLSCAGDAEQSPIDEDLAAWERATSLGSTEALQVYLDTQPEGRFRASAELMVAALGAPAEAETDNGSTGAGDMPAADVAEASTALPQSNSGGGARTPGTVFRDSLRSGGEGPEMVVVPAGSFTMGSPASESGRGSDEGPQRTVSIPRAFAVGRYEVTWDDWAACVRGGGCASNPNPSDQGWGRGRRPVINVSWNDAQEYVRWLSSQTGETYRLLSEAEWEYAARAGSTGRYAWGDQEPTCSTSAANGANYSACSDNRTHAVGSYRANRFGLHDMHGNVWEWVEDCYADSYSGAPTNGSARTSGDCSRRVLRGGSWVVNPQLLRSANRIRNAPSNRYVVSGFRLARTVSGP